MSQLIQPIVDCFVALLTGMDTGALMPFVAVQQGSHKVMVNAPNAAVLPIRTQFPDQGEGNMRNQEHEITVQLGITGGDPAELTARCIAYVQAVDAAINNFTGWPDYWLRTFVSGHDYGMMYGNASGLAYWPCLHCTVSVEELA